MKKYFSILLLVMVAFLSSCSKDDDDSISESIKEDLVGTWVSEQMSQTDALAQNKPWKYQIVIGHGTVTDVGNSFYSVGDKEYYATYSILYASGSESYVFLNNIISFPYKEDSYLWVGGNGLTYVGEKYSFQYIDHNNIMFDDKYFTRIK